MMTESYAYVRVPHSALKKENPHKMLQDENTDFS